MSSARRTSLPSCLFNICSRHNLKGGDVSVSLNIQSNALLGVLLVSLSKVWRRKIMMTGSAHYLSNPSDKIHAIFWSKAKWCSLFSEDLFQRSSLSSSFGWMHYKAHLNVWKTRYFLTISNVVIIPFTLTLLCLEHLLLHRFHSLITPGICVSISCLWMIKDVRDLKRRLTTSLGEGTLHTYLRMLMPSQNGPQL